MFIAIREINSFIDLSTHLPSIYMYAIHHHTPPLHTTVASSTFPPHARPLATSPKGKGQGVAAAGSQWQESPGSLPWRGPSTAKEKNPGGKGRTDSSSPFEGRRAHYPPRDPLRRSNIAFFLFHILSTRPRPNSPVPPSFILQSLHSSEKRATIQPSNQRHRE